MHVWTAKTAKLARSHRRKFFFIFRFAFGVDPSESIVKYHQG